MKKELYIGIDIGGTKIAAGLVDDTGKIINQKKCSTPARSTQREIVKTLSQLIEKILNESRVKQEELAGIGLGVPGIVDTQTEKIVITVNVGLSGANLSQAIERKFKIKTFTGNDVNLGLLGEQWLGAARHAQNVIGIFPGTGVGGASISHGRLVTGEHGAAAEFGHVIIDGNGPECSCGNRGCLESYISRWAIERDIRQAVKQGQTTILSDLLDDDFTKIKSGVLAEALKQHDPLVTTILKRAAGILGVTCISFKHMYDPQCIVLGGGVIEACGDFLLPIIRRVAGGDKFFTQLPPCPIVTSQLGDDAIILGAAALVKQKLPRKVKEKETLYPVLSLAKNGSVTVNDCPRKRPLFIRADDKIKSWDNKSLQLGGKDIKKACKKSPALLIIGTDDVKKLKLSKSARKFLTKQGIQLQIAAVGQAIQLYNEMDQRKAIVIL